MSPNPRPIRLIIADGQELFLEGIKTVLAAHASGYIEIVDEARNAADTVRMIRRLRPDIAMIDSGITHEPDAQWSATHTSPTGIIGMFSDQHEATVYSMFRQGHNGLLAKSSSKEEVIEAIRCVHLGQKFYCSTSSKILVKHMAHAKEKEMLQKKASIFSAIELSIIQLICSEYSTKEMAERLHLSTRSIENHSKSIKNKIGARNLVGISLFAVKYALVQLSDL